ncbi:MAG TPA: acyl-ACP--UDP-N-acetylglucosamine O-acyltransferase [Dongiaceae bacterium]|nr:acyl-ACP--UDP-N-acetylglucosamine O-acyltransferase [Dongiaceae bacterium]
MTLAVHERALVAASAKLAEGVRVGAFAVVGEDVVLGEDCVVHAHAVVQGPARFGKANVFHPFCVVGGDPQDYTFAGEFTELIAGDKNVFREYVTVSRGTKKGGGVTRMGSENFLLAYTHIGHDCQIGNGNLFVNAATLAGHVTIENYTTIGALSPVHQFCRVGSYAYIGASTVITQDVPPFSRIVTERATKSFGPNAIGLERRGFSAERVQTLQRAFRVLSRSKLNTGQAMEVLRRDFADSEDVREMVKFIEAAERGIVK